MSTPTHSNSIRVLGIDPGFDRLGVAVVEKAPQGKEVLLFSTCIETDRKALFSNRLVALGDALDAIIDEHRPTALAIETLLFNNNQKTAMQVAEARGMVLYKAQKEGLEIAEYGPSEIKVATTGYGKATKDQVATMTRQLIHITEDIKHDDEMDAIAVALTHLAHAKP